MKTVTIDSGKHTTKAMFGDKLIKFDSKVDLGKSEFENSSTVIFDNTSYIVGEEASTYDVEFSKNTDHHKILIYTAIGKLIEDETRINLVLGTPLTLFFNSKDKSEYIERISNDGMPISITIDGIKKYFSIDKCILCPEVLGGSLNDFNESKKVIRGVLDFGGLNFSSCVFDKGKPVRESMITINKGTHILETELRQEITQKSGELLEDYLLKDFLIRGCSDTKIQKIIDDYCNKFVKNIRNELLKKGYDLDRIQLYAIGGGSILLEKYIDKNFKEVMFGNDVYANVRAFEIFGRSKLDGKK